MRKLCVMLSILFVMMFAFTYAQETVLDGFEVVPGTAGWITTMNTGTSGQNVNVADGGSLATSTNHVTQGTNSGHITLNWDKPSVDTGLYPWPGTVPVWGCRWYNTSGVNLGLVPLNETIKIDVYNDTGDSIQFSILLRDQSGSGDYVNGPYVTLSPGANTYEFIPETQGSIWIALGNGVVDGSMVINSLLFYSDDEPANATNHFYVDNLRKVGAQTDTTPPAPPLLKAVKMKEGTTDQVEISWFANTETDLDGYRLYKARDFNISGVSVPWNSTPVLTESTLGSSAVSATVTLDAGSTITIFKLTAVDNATPTKNESLAGVPLAVKPTGTTEAPQVLCVVDLQRFTPDQTNFNVYEYRSFIAFLAYALEQLDEPFISATAEGVIAGAVDLVASDYKCVTWSGGADGPDTNSSVILPDAIPLISAFLDANGHLYLSGTYIASSLAATSGGPALLSKLNISSGDQVGGDTILIPSGSMFTGITAELRTNDMWNYAAYSSTSNNNLSLSGSAIKQLEFSGSASYAAAASIDSGFKAVVTGFAFESLRQDYAASADARTDVLEKILLFMGDAPEAIVGSQSPWMLYE